MKEYVVYFGDCGPIAIGEKEVITINVFANDEKQAERMAKNFIFNTNMRVFKIETFEEIEQRNIEINKAIQAKEEKRIQQKIRKEQREEAKAKAENITVEQYRMKQRYINNIKKFTKEIEQKQKEIKEMEEKINFYKNKINDINK